MRDMVPTGEMIVLPIATNVTKRSRIQLGFVVAFLFSMSSGHNIKIEHDALDHHDPCTELREFALSEDVATFFVTFA